MIVPFAKGQSPSQPLAKQPSETDMLMALGVMHSQGRFAQAANDIHTIKEGPEYDKWDEALAHYGAIRLPKELDDPQKWMNDKNEMLKSNGIDREDRPDGSVILRKKVPTS